MAGPDAKPPAKLLCVDVFSGIGGIPYALSDFCSTLVYCEWDKYCNAVLVERMNKGDLDRAPVHSDIRTLHIPEHMRPDMICGGFPCQDISSIGLQKGIVEGARSSMFFEMMRIVDESPSIRMVFLENVGNIVNCGIREVVSELKARGFDAMWTTRSAGAHGAPHCRKRWFCLAVKRCGPGESDLQIPNIPHQDSSLEEEEGWWTKEPEARVSLKPSVADDELYDPCWINRCHTLGNCVVPCVVRSVFKELATVMSKRGAIAAGLDGYMVDVDALLSEEEGAKGLLGETGMMVDGRYIDMPKKHAPCNAPPPHAAVITVKHAGKVLRMDKYPTPRRGLTHATGLSDRALRDLPTILVNCEETGEYLERKFGMVADGMAAKRHELMVPNVRYIEWMMNYPEDWTRVSPDNVLYVKPKVSAAANKKKPADVTTASTETSDE